MTADTTQPAGALPQPQSLITDADVGHRAYTKADMRAMMADRDWWRDMANRTDLDAGKLMAERDAAREAVAYLDEMTKTQGASIKQLCDASNVQTRKLAVVEDERDALRRELEELRAIPPDAREGREPLTEEQVWRDDGLMEANAIAGLPLDQFMTVVRAVEAAHGIGPAGTSADGETQHG